MPGLANPISHIAMAVSNLRWGGGQNRGPTVGQDLTREQKYINFINFLAIRICLSLESVPPQQLLELSLRHAAAAAGRDMVPSAVDTLLSCNIAAWVLRTGFPGSRRDFE